MASPFSCIHSGAMPATGRSLMSSPRPPSFTMWLRTVRTRELSTQEPRGSTGGGPIAPPPLPRAGASVLEGLRREVAVLRAGDSAAAGLGNQDVVLQKLADDVLVAEVLGEARVIASDVSHHAQQSSCDDGVVEWPERVAVM